MLVFGRCKFSLLSTDLDADFATFFALNPPDLEGDPNVITSGPIAASTLNSLDDVLISRNLNSWLGPQKF